MPPLQSCAERPPHPKHAHIEVEQSPNLMVSAVYVAGWMLWYFRLHDSNGSMVLVHS